MQESPHPLAQLLRQLIKLGGAVTRSPQEDATASCPPQRHTPAIARCVVTAVTLPASMVACPVPPRSAAANDNAEG